jgi:hypothetical protein
MTDNERDELNAKVEAVRQRLRGEKVEPPPLPMQQQVANAVADACREALPDVPVSVQDPAGVTVGSSYARQCVERETTLPKELLDQPVTLRAKSLTLRCKIAPEYAEALASCAAFDAAMEMQTAAAVDTNDPSVNNPRSG